MTWREFVDILEEHLNKNAAVDGLDTPIWFIDITFPYKESLRIKLEKNGLTVSD